VRLDQTGRIVELLDARQPFCLATVVATRAERVRTGAKVIVHPNGCVEGTIGDTALDAGIANAAVAQIAAGEIAIVAFDAEARPLTRARADPLTAVQIALEPMLPPPRMIVVGAGHIAVPLTRFAKILGFEVVIVDDRAQFANRERFPDADEVIAGDFSAVISRQRITPWTYIVLVTRGHEHDETVLQQVIDTPAPYIGMIGSRRRVLLVFERLATRGVQPDLADRVYAPIGLDIGARTAEEIALAIAAEIVNVRRGGRAPSLAARGQRGPRQRRHAAAVACAPAQSAPVPAGAPTYNGGDHG
jgi:xanthine dehydrogenase accessory factor